MTPLEMIKSGILTGNWQLVCDGYQNMTGEQTQPPSTHINAGLIRVREYIDSLLKTKTDNDVIRSVQDDDSCVFESKKATKATQYGDMALVTDPNVDEQEVMENQKKSVAAAKRKSEVRRKRYQKKTYVCSICDKEFESEYDLGTGVGQRCPTCLRSLRPS